MNSDSSIAELLFLRKRTGPAAADVTCGGCDFL